MKMAADPWDTLRAAFLLSAAAHPNLRALELKELRLSPGLRAYVPWLVVILCLSEGISL
jgi:hypothetical protein